MDRKILLQPIEESIIKQISENREEILVDPRSDMDIFLEYWESVQMDPSRVQKQPEEDPLEQGFAKLQQHTYAAYVELIKAKAVLNRTLENPLYNIRVASINYEDTQNPDQPLGTLIIDKQLSLQTSAKVLLNTANELRENIQKSRPYFRELQKLSKKIPLSLGTDDLANQLTRQFGASKKEIWHPIIASYPPSSTCIVLDSNDKESISWNLSEPVNLYVNGANCSSVFPSKYVTLNLRILMNLLFNRMKMEIIQTSFDYSIDQLSKQFTYQILDEKIEFSMKNENNFSENKDVCPVFIPPLANQLYTPGSKPFAVFKRLIDTHVKTRLYTKIILDKFINSDLCNIQCKVKKEAIVIQMKETNNNLVIACIDHVDFKGTAPDGKGLPFISFKTENPLFEKQLKDWCNTHFWLFVRHAAFELSEIFRFDAKVDKSDENQFTINTPDRSIEFHQSPEDIGIIVTGSGKFDIHLFWSSLPGIGYRERFNYLFFFKFYR